MQALLLLQGRVQITAAELAAELEVSVPTARRDLEALAMAGVPIYPTRGRGGGWRLIGGARTDLTGLTEGEVTALVIAVTQSSSPSAERTAAIRKLVQAAPAPFREGAQLVAAATVRDLPWGERDDGRTRSAVAELQRAIARRRLVWLVYGSASAGEHLDLVPLLVGSRGANWYLLAAPCLPGETTADEDRLRTYRVDRMRELHAIEEPGAAPAGFDPAEAWTRMTERVERLRGEVRAIVRVQPWAVKALCDRFGVQAAPREPGAEGGSALVEVGAQSADALAEQLAGWADVAEVIEPDDVRRALRRLGERLLARYADEGDAAGSAIR
ncbi:helix-turn-helix transcriptional regulator [Microbacterium sp. JZ37]|uniref:helix-turn-helix transcriptional regulator n=1 Tax=Microbacterium sp. JZ37 TaxID=2654193 RepID=UPI002B497871|nr:WYL domain-containing protein [Microbacterium sp. JZ37]